VYLHTGELSEEQMKEVGYQEDNWQPNKTSRANKEPALAYPFYSLNKAMLSYADLESLRGKGKFLLRRAEELAAMGLGQGPEVYSLDQEEGESVQDTNEPTSRIKLWVDELCEVWFQFSRVGRSVLGTPVEITGSQVVSLRFTYNYRQPYILFSSPSARRNSRT
jgi:hypothetical protein